MKLVTTTYPLFTLEELRTIRDNGGGYGYDIALEKLACMSGDWFDSDLLAEDLRILTGDPNAKIKGWDLDRGQYIQIGAVITPEDLGDTTDWTDPPPAMPHRELVDQVIIQPDRYGNSISAWMVGDEIAPSPDERVEEVEQWARDLCHWFWVQLRDDWEYVMSEEYLSEWAEINGWMFRENGSLA